MPIGSLSAAALDWLDPWWDPAASLLWNPEGSYAELGSARTVHLVPQSGWYAAGLLLRDGTGDRARAEATIDALCRLQYHAPGQPWDGTFAQFLEWPEPQPGAIEWVHYDPNWRQFLGTTFVVVLSWDVVSTPVAERMQRAIAGAVRGEPPDRVPPAYTNIALMRAFLEAEYGDRSRAEQYAASVVALFDADGAFAEYNSPTYYGVDLYALGLWRQFSTSPQLRTDGSRIEAALWRDIARWYHAGLGNLCGPYSRAYGMDMSTYDGMLGLCIATATDGAHVPFPDLSRPFDHSHDVSLAALIDEVGMPVPAEVVPDLVAFRGGRTIEQRLPGDRVASGWLAEDVMIGAERGAPFPARGQYHPATVHWRSPGGTAWLRVRHEVGVDAVAAVGRLDVVARDVAEGTVIVHVPGTDVAALRASLRRGQWSLPGLAVQLSSDAADLELVDVGAGSVKLRMPQATRITLDVAPD